MRRACFRCSGSCCCCCCCCWRVQVCQSQYKRENVRRRRHLLFLSSLPSSSSLVTADPSAAWALCRSVGALGLAVACGCSLAPEIDGMSSCCKVLLVLHVLTSSSLLGGAKLACARSGARSREQAGVRDAMLEVHLQLRSCVPVGGSRRNC